MQLAVQLKLAKPRIHYVLRRVLESGHAFVKRRSSVQIRTTAFILSESQQLAIDLKAQQLRGFLHFRGRPRANARDSTRIESHPTVARFGPVRRALMLSRSLNVAMSSRVDRAGSKSRVASNWARVCA